MEFQAELFFGNIKSSSKSKKSYGVEYCQFEFNRTYNEFGPSGSLKNKIIEVCVIAPGKNDLFFFDWFTSKNEMNGGIFFSEPTQKMTSSSPVQTIYFEGAQCIGLSEFYDIDTQNRRTLKLRISAELIAVNNINFISD